MVSASHSNAGKPGPPVLARVDRVFVIFLTKELLGGMNRSEDLVTQETCEKLLQHCSFREGRWGGTAGVTEWHLNSHLLRNRIVEHLFLKMVSHFWMEQTGAQVPKLLLSTQHSGFLGQGHCVFLPYHSLFGLPSPRGYTECSLH